MRFSAWWTALAIFLAATMTVAPNALWLSRSSAVIHNVGAEALTLRLVLLDEATDRMIEVGELPPGASRFLWIDPVGEATLVVEVQDGGEWLRHCANYVELGMYRVEVTVRSATEVACDTDLPLLDHLLVLDYLS